MGLIDKGKVIHNLDEEMDLGEYTVNFGATENKKIRIVFMGTPSFAVPILEGLIEQYQVVMVVCQPDRKKDRKGNVVIPDTKRVAFEHGIKVFQPMKVREDYQTIIEMQPDMIVTCAYGQIIPKELIDFPQYGCINVHGSLLPKLRGGAPIHWAIIRGFKETGITVMSMSEKMDAGDIISQKSLEIGKDEILDSLYQRMSILGRDLLLETIPSILDGTAKYFPQDEEEVTFGFNVTREEEKICFEKSGKEVHNLVRGLNSIPGAYCYLEGKRMKVYKIEIVSGKSFSKGAIGEIVDVDKDSMIVCCGDGFIRIMEIALEGKKRCFVHDYFNGIDSKSLIGKVLE